MLEIAAGFKKERLEVNFPNNIVCSIQEGMAIVRERDDRATVLLTRRFGSLFVIDGQHRLSASALLPERFRRSFRYIVTAFEGLEEHEEARLFAAINRKQKGVDRDLVDYILSRLPEKTPESIAPSIILELGSARSGVFDVGVKTGFSNGGVLRLHQLSACLLERRFVTEEGGLLQRRPGDIVQPTEMLVAFFRAVRDACPSEWGKRDKGFLHNSIGVLVMLEVLSAIINARGHRPRRRTDDLQRFAVTRVGRLRRYRFPTDWRKETRREVRAENVRSILEHIGVSAKYFDERP